VGTDAKAREYLGFIRKLCEAAAVECTPLALVSDTPWEAIVNVAEDCTCDLIFMSKHGRSSSLTSLLLGSETHRVLTHSNIPVLVYRPPGIGATAPQGQGNCRQSARLLKTSSQTLPVAVAG
jgi:nucleotide-binding universal stress UspA family protein